MKKQLLLMHMMLLPMVASAYDAYIDGIYYNLSQTEKIAQVSDYDFFNNQNAYSGDVIIPATVYYNGESYTVTAIGAYAFRNCCDLVSVIIPNTVITIGAGAFAFCSCLTSVTIPNSVTTIETYAFNDCYGLKSVNISDLAAWCKIEFNSTPLSYQLYMNGEEIINLVIPDSVTNIADYAFSGCISLTSVTIPNSVTSIGTYAFSGCSGLTSVTIPNSVTSIGKATFQDCSSLTSVTIPNSVTSIGEATFNNCSSLASVTIPNSVTSIGEATFEHCI